MTGTEQRTEPGSTERLPPQAFAAALAGLSGMHIRRLGALLRHHHPRQAFEVVAGTASGHEAVNRFLADPAIGGVWRREATVERVERVWQRCRRLGVEVLVIGDPQFPVVLRDDRLPPPVLFVKGTLDLLGGRRVGIVGTRNATAAGRAMAVELGEQLAQRGVHVVSGLARGIDGSAHVGVLRAGGPGAPVGVVASGHDVVYPREHDGLWEHVGQRGLLVSESAPGGRPEAYRFPLRNRLIAAFSEVLVVVESRERGGSLITVTEAMDRGVPVMAVPGRPGSPASVGTNALLREGAAPVVDVDDVMAVLHTEHRRTGVFVAEQRPRPSRPDIAVYEVCATRPGTIDAVAAATGVPLLDAAMALARLEHTGWVVQTDGWFEPVGAPLR